MKACPGSPWAVDVVGEIEGLSRVQFAGGKLRALQSSFLLDL